MKPLKHLLFLFIALGALAAPCSAAFHPDSITSSATAPADFADGLNLYIYCQQNPWTKYDPEGLSSWEWDWSDLNPIQAVLHVGFDVKSDMEDAGRAMDNAQANADRSAGKTSEQMLGAMNQRTQIVKNALPPIARLAASAPYTTLNPVFVGENPENAAVAAMPGGVGKAAKDKVALAAALSAEARQNTAALTPSASAKADVEQSLLMVSKDANPWAGATTSSVTPDTVTYYRVWGGKTPQEGAWLTPVKPTSAEEARATLALPPTNTAENVSTVTVPKGTRIQLGTAAANFNQPGGGAQVQLQDKIPPLCVRGHRTIATITMKDLPQALHGKVDGYAVRKILEIPNSDDVIVLLVYWDDPAKFFQNLIRLAPSGDVVWRAKYPMTTHDAYVEINWQGSELIGNTWDGYWTVLDADTGNVLSSTFVK